MSLHLLAVAPRDVAAETLGLVLDAHAPATLAELRSEDRRGGTVTLGVLGASHVVTATRPGHRITEQVSCDALGLGGRALPDSHRDGGYRFSSTTREVPSAELAGVAGRLRRAAEHDTGWLCGAFPGSDTALTALTATPVAGGWTWQTWHLYPAGPSGVVVRTRSRWVP